MGRARYLVGRSAVLAGHRLRELRLDPDRLYLGLGGRWPVHNVLRQDKVCAWQESNLLPHAPQACALSGELQARQIPDAGCRVLII